MKQRLLIITLFFAAACRHAATDHEAYQKEMEQWHANRLERLKGKESWLDLAGLYWLEDGLNTFGSDSTGNLIFPQEAPAMIGTVELKDSTVTLIAVAQPVMIDSQLAVAPVKLADDMSGKPTRMTLGRYSWYVIKRGDRFGFRLRDYESPLRDTLTVIPAFSTNEDYKVEAKYVPYDKPEILKMKTVLGTEVENHVPGELQFRLHGEKYTLYPVESDGEWSLVFGDLTNGEETYDGGRFLDIDKPDENNRVLIDFNKAYNPPCVFTPYATCELPHPKNILHVRIEAGEKALHLVNGH